MTLSVQLGVVMAVVTAFASIVGFLLKHRGAVAAPPVERRHPLRSTVDLFCSLVVRDRVRGGHDLIGASTLLLALGLAPISIVRSVIAGRLVLLTVTPTVCLRAAGHAPRARSGGPHRGRPLPSWSPTLEGAG